MKTRINGNAYDWSNIKVTVSGAQDVVVNGISKISWKVDRDFSNNYGAGVLPVAQGFGNHTFEASMTISMEEMGIIANAFGQDDLLNVPEFDIIIEYGSFDGKSHNTTLTDCRLHNMGLDVSQNDMNIEFEINLNPSNIINNSWTL